MDLHLAYLTGVVFFPKDIFFCENQEYFFRTDITADKFYFCMAILYNVKYTFCFNSQCISKSADLTLKLYSIRCHYYLSLVGLNWV